jgi:hypothetical protein
MVSSLSNPFQIALNNLKLNNLLTNIELLQHFIRKGQDSDRVKGKEDYVWLFREWSAYTLQP